MNETSKSPSRRPLSHVGLCVSDLDASSSFYRHVLGFEHAVYFDLGAEISTLVDADEDFRCRCEMLVQGDFALELIQYFNPTSECAPAPRSINRTGLSHLSFYVDDLLATADLIDLHGGRALRHTETRIADKGRAMFCLDPGETRVELMQMSIPLLQEREYCNDTTEGDASISGQA